jgi:hypothetical protein
MTSGVMVRKLACRCYHQGMSTMNFTYNPAKPDTQEHEYRYMYLDLLPPWGKGEG